jgi:hypothetical protein
VLTHTTPCWSKPSAAQVYVAPLKASNFRTPKSGDSSDKDCDADGGLLESIRNHSLTIFLTLTGLAWIILYVRMDSEAKWGQDRCNFVRSQESQYKNRGGKSPDVKDSCRGIWCFARRFHRWG